MTFEEFKSNTELIDKYYDVTPVAVKQRNSDTLKCIVAAQTYNTLNPNEKLIIPLEATQVTSNISFMNSVRLVEPNVKETLTKIADVLASKVNVNVFCSKKFTEDEVWHKLILRPLTMYGKEFGLQIMLSKNSSDCIATIIDENEESVRNTGYPIYYNNADNLEITTNKFSEDAKKELYRQFGPKPEPKKRTFFDKIGDVIDDGLLAISDHHNKVDGW